MIDPKTFTKNHIQYIREISGRDPALIEKSIFAMGLLEAIARTGLKFIFKGGSSLMLLLDRPKRFSTDVDIIVEPGTDMVSILDKAASIWPFVKMTEHIRKVSGNIETRHFKFGYSSPMTGRELTILLDVLFEKNHYSTLISKNITCELLLTHEPMISVDIPNVNCIIADKLTAFAPHTTGIPFGKDKELEIIKQLFDIASLLEYVDDLIEVTKVFKATAETELRYRNLDISTEDILNDVIDAAVCVAGRGKFNKDDYSLYRRGISRILNHIYTEKFNGELAVSKACMILFLASALITEQPVLPKLRSDEYYQSPITSGRYKVLSYVRTFDPIAYKYLFEAAKMLENHGG
jgi:predicted nucleotidyltransferase component of viral defense system